MKRNSSVWALSAAAVLSVALLGAKALPTRAQGMASPTTTAAAMTPLDPMDQLFMVRAGEGNLAEVTMSDLALSKSKNPQVQAIAKKLIQDHGKAQTALLTLSRSKGMMMSPMLSAGHMVIYKALQKAKKNQFDMMYLAAQVDDHENTVALFQTEIANGQDADLKGYATTYLPPIVGHTAQIYMVARAVGAPGMAARPKMPPTPPGVAVPDMSSMDMGMPMATPMPQVPQEVR